MALMYQYRNESRRISVRLADGVAVSPGGTGWTYIQSDNPNLTLIKTQDDGKGGGSEVEAAVAAYFAQHTIGDAVADYMKEHPVSGSEVSAKDIEKAVEEYFDNNPVEGSETTYNMLQGAGYNGTKEQYTDTMLKVVKSADVSVYDAGDLGEASENP